MEFKSYNKIHRLGKEETEGILEGTVYVQEKIDGANASIWVGDDGEIHCGSRTQDVTQKPFNGFPEYVKAHEGIKQMLHDYPGYRLYGEWLVKHTIGYNETSYRKFYLYEIHTEDGILDIQDMYLVAMAFGIETAHFIGKFVNPRIEDIEKYAGQSVLGAKGEGVVIKNLDFRNKFGDRCHAKIVTQEFKEDNGVTFGGNNKHSETYEEMYVCNKYMTLERIRKIMQKVESMDGKLDLKDCPKIASMAYHDLLTEEIWEIAKNKRKIDFAQLQNICTKKAIFIFKDVLINGENASVAYNPITDGRKTTTDSDEVTSG